MEIKEFKKDDIIYKKYDKITKIIILLKGKMRKVKENFFYFNRVLTNSFFKKATYLVTINFIHRIKMKCKIFLIKLYESIDGDIIMEENGQIA